MQRKLTQEQIDHVFATATDQSDAIISLFKIVFPKWDRIKAVGGYPHVSEATSKYLCGKAIAFDTKHHPDVMAGGAWMNYGFSSVGGENIPDWVVDTSECKVEYQPQAAAA